MSVEIFVPKVPGRVLLNSEANEIWISEGGLMADKVKIYQILDGTLREGGPVDRSDYEKTWKRLGWRLSPPKQKKEKETE